MMHAEIRELLDRVYAAWGDAEAFAALYRPDATVVMPGVFRQGRDAVRESMAAAWAGPLRDSTPIDEPLDIRVLGDSAVVVSRAGILLSGQSALTPAQERTATWVLTRAPGEGWAVAAYSNTPAAA
ncbi:SgcJ/EcaC family oxidoreductase [Asanoa sp. NPDC049518]|uniref:SgcJ/EcaC family oxidoreductase n=1 Tax=unclassified Asanoa TaxID=2685164 RepID=UPI00343AABAC